MNHDLLMLTEGYDCEELLHLIEEVDIHHWDESHVSNYILEESFKDYRITGIMPDIDSMIFEYQSRYYSKEVFGGGR